MNKYEQLEKDAENLLQQIKGLSEPNPTRWKPEHGQLFYFVDLYGKIDKVLFDGDPSHEALWETGNCFRTEEEAKRSRIYKAFHDPYEYWIGGIDSEKDKPEKLPEECEVHDERRYEWVPCTTNPEYWRGFRYRWLKERSEG